MWQESILLVESTSSTHTTQHLYVGSTMHSRVGLSSITTTSNKSHIAIDEKRSFGQCEAGGVEQRVLPPPDWVGPTLPLATERAITPVSPVSPVSTLYALPECEGRYLQAYAGCWCHSSRGDLGRLRVGLLPSVPRSPRPWTVDSRTAPRWKIAGQEL